MNQLLVKKLHPNAVLPHYAHPGEDAAFDLCCVEDFYLYNNSPLKVRTGIACQFPSGFFANILGRSGLASKGVSVLGGVIDSGYRGEWHVQMIRISEDRGHLFFRAGDKIAQCVMKDIPHFQVIETDTLTESARGEKGFGSTDKNVPYRKLHAP